MKMSTKSDTYAYGVPKNWIWLIHISIGLYFLVMGFIGINSQDQELSLQVLFYSLVIFGILMVFYHGHLLIAKMLNWS